MEILRLDGHSAHLRKVARAFAAGEVSLEEYRRVREEVLRRMDRGDDDAEAIVSTDDDIRPTEILTRREPMESRLLTLFIGILMAALGFVLVLLWFG